MFLSILFDQNIKFLWSDLNIYLIRNCDSMTNDHIGGCRSNPPIFEPGKRTVSRLLSRLPSPEISLGRGPKKTAFGGGFSDTLAGLSPNPRESAKRKKMSPQVPFRRTRRPSIALSFEAHARAPFSCFGSLLGFLGSLLGDSFLLLLLPFSVILAPAISHVFC